MLGLIITTVVSLSSFLIYEIIHYIWFITSSRSRYYDANIVKSTMYLSWKELCDFYAVNPNRWMYCKSDIFQDVKHLYYIKNKNNIIAITMSFVSYMRLLYKYHFGHKKDTKVKEAFLIDVQKDIDALKRKAQAEINQANRAMEQINSKIKEEKK